MLCATKARTGQNKGQCCAKRSLCYEIWCMECKERSLKEIDENEDWGEEEKEKRKKEIKLYKYIGETSRSAFERGWEHRLGLQSLSEDSYMLKHALDQHPEDLHNLERYGLKIIKYTKTPFERQVRESVYLQENTNHHLLNSKSEYNRCSIPRLTTKLGEKEVREGKKEEEREKRKDAEISRRIRELRKEKNKSRKSENEEKTGDSME